MQVMDRLDLHTAQGVPLAFTDYLEQQPGSMSTPRRVTRGIPEEKSIVQPGSGLRRIPRP